VDLDEILYGGVATGEDYSAVLSNPVTSSILKWLKLKLLR
jgi:hypothetical protein